MVYIDSYNAKYRRMIMCHMMADTSAELIEMAKAIGVAERWIQDKDTPREHFDICLSMKAKALKLGAKEVGWKEIANLCQRTSYNGIEFKGSWWEKI